MEDTSQIQSHLFDYVKKNSFTNISKVNSGTLLFKEGIFDSMAFVLLIDFIEEKFGITPGDEDLVEENFESLDAITSYILRKKAN